MSDKTFPTVGRRTQVIAALAGLAALCAGLAFFTGPGNQAGAADDATTAKAKQAVILGANGPVRDPLCPSRCTGVAIVSGVQAQINGAGQPFRVPFKGKITRWKLALGKPNASQRDFFQTKFGERPEAALGVLKKTRKDGKAVYKLRKRTAVIGLNRYLGTTASLPVKHPLAVNKGDIVALIVPTWAPALWTPAACDLVKDTATGEMVKKNATACANFTDDYSWVASRDKSTCSKPINMKTSQAQLKVGSAVPYGCRFRPGQLTYRVRVESR
ncbi:MAG: hypothetical protein J0H98_10350 [Solirubrobacterales bacterium]|nr:hypothetical protein [Solirubrobacterales bacterium]